MQQKKRQKLRVSDLLLVLICLAVCAISFWFFWKDLNTSTARTDVDSIATIHFKRKISQRKFDDRVVWERLQQDSPLYDKDTIRTSDGAEAVILFDDGTKVDLNENTMIQIAVENDGSVNLSVGGGNIEVDTRASKSESVKLSMGDGSSVNLEKGSRISAVTNDQTGAASSFTVKDGNAVVSNAAGQSQKISGGEAVSIEKNGELSRQSITVTSISKNLRVYKSGEEVEPVKLSWQAVSDNSKPAEATVKVEVSTDKNFTNIIEEYKAQGSSSIDVLPQTENNKLFWRVYKEDEKEKAVEGVITVVELNRMELTSPLDNSVFSYRKELPTLRFNWNYDEYAESYQFEVSRTQDFAAPVIKESLKTTSYSTAALEKGRYYWRVTPYYSVNSIGYGQASKLAGFEIEEREALAEPALSLPADSAKIVLGDSEQNVIFAWKSDVKNADYTIQLSDNPDFRNVIHSVNSSATTVGEHFNIKTLPQGTYYWKVLRASAEDRESGNDHAQSAVRSFTVAPYIPGLNKLSWPPDGYAVEQEQLARLGFSWKLASEYKAAGLNSVLQIAKSDTFNNIIESQTLSKAEYSGLSLDSGSYYWRVGVVKDGEETAFSEAHKLRVLNPMAAPKIIQPEEAGKLVVAYETPVDFEWQPVIGADYYKLAVYDAEGNIIKNEKLTEAKASLELPVESDYLKYRASIQAFAKETEISSARYSEEGAVTFEVRRPLPVTLISPVNNQSYDGLAALRTPIQLVWKYGDVSTRTVLTLQKQNSNGSWRTVRTMENPKTTVSLSRLTEGRYRWSVSASGEKGLSLDSSSQTFVVKQVPLLEAAALTEPSNSFKMDSVYLKNHRNISFKWKKVAGATDYDFAVYQVLSNGSYKRVYSQSKLKQTELRIKDLSIFDVGTFEWRVIAYSHAKDGFEEQKSREAASRFTIDFGLPSKVKTGDPGTMYGE